MAEKTSEIRELKPSSKVAAKIFTIKSLKYLLLLIILIGISLGIAFGLGQLTFGVLQTNASNAGHIYGIIISAAAFFLFERYLRGKKDLNFTRKFIMLYFAFYFALVSIIILPLFINPIYLFSTIGNALILFSVFILIVFLLNPEILGIRGALKMIFTEGKHVRLIGIYILIFMLQVFGFSLLNYAIQLQAGGSAFYLAPGFSGNWFDFLYLSIITFTTIGFGDIYAISVAAKFSVVTQAILSHILTVLFLAILIVYISSALGSPSQETPKSSLTN